MGHSQILLAGNPTQKLSVGHSENPSQDTVNQTSSASPSFSDHEVNANDSSQGGDTFVDLGDSETIDHDAALVSPAVETNANNG